MITSCRDGQQIPNSGLVAFIHAVRLAAMQVVGLNGVSHQCRRCLGSKSSTATNRLVITSCCDGGWQISGEMELDCVGACYYSHAGLCECLLLLARHMAVYYPDTHAQVPKRVPTCNHLPLVALDAAALMRAERRGFFVLAPASLVAMLRALRLLPRFCRFFVRLGFFFLSPSSSLRSSTSSAPSEQS